MEYIIEELSSTLPRKVVETTTISACDDKEAYDRALAMPQKGRILRVVKIIAEISFL